MSKRANKKNRKQREQRIKNNVKVDDIEKLIVSRWLQSKKGIQKEIKSALSNKVTIKTYTNVPIANQYNFGGGSGNFGDKDITSEIASYGTPISIMAIESGGGNPCFCSTYESGGATNARVVCLATFSASRKADITVVYSK